MRTRATTSSGWDYDDHDYCDDYEPDHVATVDDGFERGAALNAIWIRVQAQELRSGHVTAVLAGVTLDLRQATLSPEGATIRVQSALSGIAILVPPDWDVACDVDAICGGVGEDRRAPRLGQPRPRLRVVGMVVAGGLSVR